MTDLRETLRRLARSFVARDLMVPKEDLVCSEDERDAEQKLEANSNFDVIPIRRAGTLVAFLERGQSQPRTIQVQHLIGSETPIVDLVDSFHDRSFLFVVGRQEIVGLVHFSDLNDPVVKLPYFALLEGVERQVADTVGPLVLRESLPQFIRDPKRVTQIVDKMDKLRANKADRDWVTILYFREILEAACYFGRLSLKVSEIEDLSAVRTLVAHAATKELVETHSDVQRLRNIGSLCSRILFVNKV
jgi:hypothetical protein